MEKICIVKRRREHARLEVKVTPAPPDNHSDTLPSKVAKSDTAADNQSRLSHKKIVEEFMDDSSSVISIIMTKEQSALLQQSEYIKELLGGAKKDPSLNIKIDPDGQLALNFRYNESILLRMLCSNQVCQMLQISKSFLQKLVNEKKLNSYKLGRMRRFLLEDILEYLSNDEEFAQLKK
jgi:excisionase family DNA binding protein